MSNPATWSDSLQRTWLVRLNLQFAIELRDVLGVDLLGEASTAVVAGMLADHERLGRVLWHLTAKQAEARSVSQEDFKSALDGDSLAVAWGALHDAYLAFCPAASRAAVEKTIARQVEAMETAAALAAEMVDGPEARGAIQRAIDETVREIKANLSTIGSEPTT